MAASPAPHSQSHSVLSCHLPVYLFITTTAARLINKTTNLNLPARRRMMTHIFISTPPPHPNSMQRSVSPTLPSPILSLTRTHTRTHKQPRWRPNECQVQVTLTFLKWQNRRKRRWGGDEEQHGDDNQRRSLKVAFQNVFFF